MIQNKLYAALVLAAKRNASKIYGAATIARHIQQTRRIKPATGSISQTNRNTGKAHEHKREIARRLRQAGAK